MEEHYSCTKTQTLSNFSTQKRQTNRWHLFSTWNCSFSACWLSCHRRRRRYPGSWPFSHAARFWGPSHPHRSSADRADGAEPVCCPSTAWHRWTGCQSGPALWALTDDGFHPFWLKVLNAARSAVFLKVGELQNTDTQSISQRTKNCWQRTTNKKSKFWQFRVCLNCVKRNSRKFRLPL